MRENERDLLKEISFVTCAFLVLKSNLLYGLRKKHLSLTSFTKFFACYYYSFFVVSALNFTFYNIFYTMLYLVNFIETKFCDL